MVLTGATLYASNTSALYAPSQPPTTFSPSTKLTTIYTCGHTTSEPQRTALADNGSHIFLHAPCSKHRACTRGAPAALALTKTSLGDREKQFLNAAALTLYQAEQNASTSLRLLSLAPPVLEAEMADACGGCTAVASAMEHSGWVVRGASVRELLRLGEAKFWQQKLAVMYANEAAQAHVDFAVGMVREIADKATVSAGVLARAVEALTVGSAVSAPGRVLRRSEALETFEAGWGVAELGKLRATDEGRAILAMGFGSEGILAARAYLRVCEQAAAKEMDALDQYQTNVRRAFVRDYPGMARHYARAAAGLADEGEQSHRGQSNPVKVPAAEDVLVIDVSDSDSNSSSQGDSDWSIATSSAVTAVDSLASDVGVDGLTQSLPGLSIGQGEDGKSRWTDSTDIVAGYCKKDIRSVRPSSRTLSKKMSSVRATQTLHLQLEERPKTTASPSAEDFVTARGVQPIGWF